MIVVDTSLLYALLDAGDRMHEVARAWYETGDEQFVTTPLVLAELDHLALHRAGGIAADALREDVRSGAYLVEWWATAAAEAVDVAQRYRDLGVSLTDASLVALAGRTEVERIGTFDERHFRAMRPLTKADSFVLLPLDVE